jgi:hypothetical protein
VAASSSNVLILPYGVMFTYPSSLDYVSAFRKLAAAVCR